MRLTIGPAAFALALVSVGFGVRPSFAEWQLFTPGSGAEAAYVSTICEDRKGDLWFGGVKVSRYDGVRWQNYSLGHTVGFPYLAAIREDHEGAMWFVEYGWGVTRYDGTTWQLFREGSGIPLANVTTVAIDTRGDVWVGADRGGVCRWDGTHWQGYPELANHSVMFSLADRHGNVWFATYVIEQGFTTYALIRYDGTSMRTMTTADGIPAEWMGAMCEDDHGNVWFAYSTAGLIRYDGTSIHPGRDNPDAGVTVMIADHEDNLWMATENRGVVQLRPDGSWRRITTADGLSSNEVAAMHVDRRGNLWFASPIGINRWDGTSWRSFRRPELPFDYVESGLQDRSGDLWIAASPTGVYRYDGVSWWTYSTADAPSGTSNILQDRSGNLWFGGSNGLARYDGSVWEDYSDSLSLRWVSASLEDREGKLWFVTNGEVFGRPTVLKRYDGTRSETVLPPFSDFRLGGCVEDRDGSLWFGLGIGGRGQGVARYDGTNWVVYTTADGLPSNDLLPALEDRYGTLWFQSSTGPVSFDGSSWRLHSIPTTANSYVNSMREDRLGHLWVATDRGVSRYDGQNWGTYFASNGLLDDRAWRLVVESSGAVWVGTQLGITRFEPDLVPPQTVAVTKPPALSPNRVVSAAVLAAFGESRGIGYSFRLDGGAWSDWAAAGSWLVTDISDGSHLLEARTRDQIGNVDPYPVSMPFEIDASPPIPVITAPASGTIVRDVVEIRGTSRDPRFRRSTVTFRRAGEATFLTLARSDSAASDASLATWDTDSLPDGRYEIRLAVEDTLGLTGTAIVTVDVQRNPSIRIVAVDGGEVRSADGDLRVSFPPRAFREDAVVRIVPLADGEAPATLPGAATRVAVGARLDWGDAVLEKAADLELSFASAAPAPHGALALYGSRGETWTRIGGTVDAGARTISTRITGPGAYALYAEGAAPSGTGGLTDVALTPRVFSPRGGYAGDRIAISFTLGRAASVSVRIYNRAGRLVRMLADGEPMGPGTNLVRWDGRDRDSSIVADGLYVVTIEALGERRTSTLAVVR